MNRVDLRFKLYDILYLAILIVEFAGLSSDYIKLITFPILAVLYVIEKNSSRFFTIAGTIIFIKLLFDSIEIYNQYVFSPIKYTILSIIMYLLMVMYAVGFGYIYKKARTNSARNLLALNSIAFGSCAIYTYMTEDIINKVNTTLNTNYTIDIFTNLPDNIVLNSDEYLLIFCVSLFTFTLILYLLTSLIRKIFRKEALPLVADFNLKSVNSVIYLPYVIILAVYLRVVETDSSLILDLLFLFLLLTYFNGIAALSHKIYTIYPNVHRAVIFWLLLVLIYIFVMLNGGLIFIFAIFGIVDLFTKRRMVIEDYCNYKDKIEDEDDKEIFY